MNKSICSIHDQEEEKYICVHPHCIKKVDNKLSCIQCFSNKHKKIKLEKHQFINLSELEQKAIDNYNNLKRQLNDEIQKNQQLNTIIQERLAAVLLSLSTWQNNQKKMFNDIAENSSQVLTENILKADSLMKNPSLDTFIYFFNFKILEKEKENQDIREYSMRQLEYSLKQIEEKRDILINQQTFIQREQFLKFSFINYQIESDNLKEYQFEKCQKHLSKQKMLCTHPNCLEKNSYQLQCIHCISEEHKEHQLGTYIKNIAIIQKEQAEKLEQIEQLKKKYSIDIKQSIDKNLSKINEIQKDYYQNYEKQKEKAIFLEQYQLNQFSNPNTPNYIFGNIDTHLLKTTKDQINLYYQQLYYNFEIKFQTIFFNQVNDDIKFCTELDFNSKQFFQYVINLEQELELCKIQLQEYKKQIEEYNQNSNQIELQMKTQSAYIINLQSSISSLELLTQSNLIQQNASINQLQSNLEYKISQQFQYIIGNSKLQNVTINNLQSDLEKSIGLLQQLIKSNQEQENASINSLLEHEKDISNLLSLNSNHQKKLEKISDQLKLSLEKDIALPLKQLTQSNIQQEKEISELKTSLRNQEKEVQNILGRKQFFFFIFPIILVIIQYMISHSKK
ncbi:unnamed protein product [Paramecium pentaurelia]|uniref:Transmembrane protein n=1 Tax=Paramecium pentaurelia TaxID=43138 RepID=A0A8S1W5B0_9CILI|nr:unnamed protein product [Paramecium pentaurelia]